MHQHLLTIPIDKTDTFVVRLNNLKTCVAIFVMKLNKLELQIEKNKAIKQVLFTANFCYNAFKCHIHECINCQGIVFIEKSVQGHFCTTWSPQDLVFCVEVFLMV